MVILKEYTYAKSGVDIKKEAKVVNNIVKSLSYRRDGFGKKINLEEGYSGLIDIGDKALAMATDGVGTKIIVANMMKKWDTVGIDCIAMNVNDLIAVGAEPIAMVDYLAVEETDSKIISEIAKGLNEGAKQSNIDIVGGETATLKGIVKGLDLAATAIGYVDKDKIITGKTISKGDSIIGIESSGLHSNGYTLAREVLLDNLDISDPLPSDKNITVGEALLIPTIIYVKAVLELIKNFKVHGLAHITGSGFLNLKRLNKKFGYKIDNPPEMKPIFKDIMEIGSVSEKEMFSTFNMGIGFCIICNKNIENDIISKIKNHNLEAYKIGEVTENSEVVEIGDNLKL